MLSELEAAVALLPQVAARELIRVDQEHAVANLASLPGQVAAAAVAAGRAGRAVELLEQTRGIMVADVLDARSSDLTRLRGHLSGLAEEFEKLRTRLDVLNRAGRAAGPGDLTRQRRDAYRAWDDLITRIRKVDGFEDFLEPPDIRRLARQAAAGPVIFPYTSPSGCGALLLTDDPGVPVRAVSLDLSEEDAFRQAESLLDALAGAAQETEDGGRAAQRALSGVLAWVWDAITGPVLTALGYTGRPAADQPWPRVWWCPIGVLAYLPLHAAGHHDDRLAEARPLTVMDRVVSSYAATVRGMAYSRAQQPAPAVGDTLIVAVPDAPGVPPLPGANREAQFLSGLIPGARVLPRPTRDAVLAALPRGQVVHFACHGYADAADPSASQLILYDHGTSPLSLADISALRLVSELAYLSACETTVTSLELADEAVHITGAFHLAGYQNVIGTLWPVNDGSAALIARDFYRTITGDGTKAPNSSLASHALHTATRRLRARFPDQPTHWAGYIHTGR